jgi:hypothetical protein
MCESALKVTADGKHIKGWEEIHLTRIECEEKKTRKMMKAAA